uniref:Spore coat associated protein JA (CotJA) n=1 Tax=termite gut metagenome TaxID=433724 RepID=S0DDY9_9ZZZZ
MKNGWIQNGSETQAKQDIKQEMPVMPVMPTQMPATEATRIANCETYVMVKINMQEWDEIYEPDLGFERGTIFPALDLPFVGEGACRYE